MNSSNHALSEQGAEDAVQELAISMHTETADMRKQYRDHVDAAQAHKMKWPGVGKGDAKNKGGKGGGKGKGAAVDILIAEIALLKRRIEDENDASSSVASVVKYKQPKPTRQKVLMTKESLDRAHNSLNAAQRLLQSSATAFQERAAACASAAAAIGDEVQVIVAAKEFLNDIARDMS